MHLVPVLPQPALLERHPERSQQHVGLRPVDLLDHRAVRRAPDFLVEKPVVRARDDQAGVLRLESSLRLLGHARRSAEKEKRKPFLRAEPAKHGKPVRVRDLLGYPQAAKPRPQHDAVAVAEDVGRCVQEVAEPRLLPRDVHRVDIHIGDDRLAPGGDDLRDRLVKRSDRERVHANTHEVVTCCHAKPLRAGFSADGALLQALFSR